MLYAFYVNSDACSGCKTCQVACCDAHGIPARATPWREVIEVVAGGWTQKGTLWSSNVTAYNLSVACHHCTDFVCAKGCQGDAIWKRHDGIVLIDNIRCTRCRKCESDCPYGAIHWDDSTNTEYKCDFCADDIDNGSAPVCVAACPNRALDFGELSELRERYGKVQQVYPLPDPSISDPSLVIKPHRNVSPSSAPSGPRAPSLPATPCTRPE